MNALGRHARRVVALVALVATIIGVPWLLAAFADLSPLWAADWAAAMTGAADGHLLVALLGVIGWAAWAYFTASIAVEVAGQLRHAQLRRPSLPGTSWVRSLVAAALAASAVVPTVAVAAPVATPAPVPPSATAAQEAPATPAAPARVHTVVHGEELWDVAAAELGAGERWREIAELNPGVTASSLLTASQRLRLPEASREAPSPDATITVKRGDTLWDIAERALGEPERWPEIHALNRSRIADPDAIDVGWVLRLPPRPSAPAAGTADRPADPEAAPDASGHGSAAGQPESADEPLVVVDAPLPEAGDVDRPGTPTTKASPSPLAAEKASASPPAADDLAPLAAVGGALAAAVLAGVATRRRAQLLGRAVGRRLVPVGANVARFWAALASRAEGDGGPAGATATTVLLGWEDDGAEVLLDLATERATRLDGAQAPDLAAAVVTSLTCAPWSEEVAVVLVGDGQWAGVVDDPRIEAVADPRAGVARLTRMCAERRLALRSLSLAEAASDPDLAAAFAPVVFVFEGPLTGTQPDAVADALALGEVAVSVLVLGARTVPGFETLVHVEGDRATWGRRTFTPQLVPEAARRALIELFSIATTLDTLPAPWWEGTPLPEGVASLPPRPAHSDSPDPTAGPAEISQLPLRSSDAETDGLGAVAAQGPPSQEESVVTDPPEHPMVLLLGEVELIGAAGIPPSRARMQCIEYCAWLLAHPQARATAMTSGLLVAETTRRSNMSRLRSWLGEAPDGAPYLPDAYSGSIALDPRVTSDWETFLALLSPGIRHTPDAALRAALRQVRGAPLGSASFQWPWAETLRVDMTAMIVDAAAALADRALERGDATAVLWAVGRGKLAAPLDDELAVRELQALALAGRSEDLRHAIVALNRSLRSAGRDLAPHLALRVSLALSRDTAIGSVG